MFDLNTYVAEAIAREINRDHDIPVIETLEVCALADGVTTDTPLTDFVTLCHYYSDTNTEIPLVATIDGITYCMLCGDIVLSAECICTM